MEKEGCEKIYSDVGSGVREYRNGLLEMLDFLRKGDTYINYKNDRIFRSLKNIIDTFNDKGVYMQSLYMITKICR